MQQTVTKVPTQLWGTAHHEAGHTVVHLHFGLPFDYVTIVPEEGAHGHMVHPSPMEIHADERTMTGERRKMARQMILGCYAGLYAERLAARGVPDRHALSDFADALRLSMTYKVLPRNMDHLGDELHLKYLRKLRRQSKRLVRELSLPIRKFAQHLLRRKTITGEEAETAIWPRLSGRVAQVDPMSTAQHGRILESRDEEGHKQHMFIAAPEM